MTGAAQLTARLESLDALVSRARHQLAVGGELEVVPIETEVAALCGWLGVLPLDQAGDLRPRLVGLLEEVSALAEALQQELDAVSRELGDGSLRRQAVTAYAKPAGSRE